MLDYKYVIFFSGDKLVRISTDEGYSLDYIVEVAKDNIENIFETNL